MITVSAVLIRDDQGRVLTVRKEGTAHFMFPGGKWEPGETGIDAAIRETAEELDVSISEVRSFGVFETPAANEPGEQLRAHVFTAVMLEEPRPSAEIAELAWVAAESPHVPLAPLLADAVFPALPNPIKAVTVFCGSADGSSPAYSSAARTMGTKLAHADLTLIYGGGRVGLMGTLADAVLAAKGQAIGIIPQHLESREIAHNGLSELIIVPDMHVRKTRMAELGDAFVALPGGAGTLEELFEAWTWQMLGLHRKPVALYGRDFWAPLVEMLHRMVDQGFIASKFLEALILADSPSELLQRLHAWTPPTAKWD